MAIVLYASGVSEYHKSLEHTFKDSEILGIFKDFRNVRTQRLEEVPNTWCIWGEKNDDNIDEGDFNKLGSDVVDDDIYSPLMFIHDSEIDPSWMLTDEVILYDYNTFQKELLIFIDEIAEVVLAENEKIRQAEGRDNSLIFLTTIGPTEDKRVLFQFNPTIQNEQFYKNENLLLFANKVLEFLEKEYKKDNIEETLFIFEDKKSVIFIRDEHVDETFEHFTKAFESEEKYEKCVKLKEIKEKWKSVKKNSKKDDKPKDNKKNDKNNDKNEKK